MNLMSKPPLGIKDDRASDDPAYLARVRTLPCCICAAYGEPQLSATQAHHVFHDRHGTARAPDRMAIPLCEGHHQGLVDRSKLAIHRAKAAWREAYGADREWVAPTQDRLGV